jgi:hypothetical protein
MAPLGIAAILRKGRRFDPSLIKKSKIFWGYGVECKFFLWGRKGEEIPGKGENVEKV